MQIGLCKYFDTCLNYAISNTDILNQSGRGKHFKVKINDGPRFPSMYIESLFFLFITIIILSPHEITLSKECEMLRGSQGLVCG
jgi:hypothetical protein